MRPKHKINKDDPQLVLGFFDDSSDFPRRCLRQATIPAFRWLSSGRPRASPLRLVGNTSERPAFSADSAKLRFQVVVQLYILAVVFLVAVEASAAAENRSGHGGGGSGCRGSRSSSSSSSKWPQGQGQERQQHQQQEGKRQEGRRRTRWRRKRSKRAAGSKLELSRLRLSSFPPAVTRLCANDLSLKTGLLIQWHLDQHLATLLVHSFLLEACSTPQSRFSLFGIWLAVFEAANRLQLLDETACV